MKAFLAALALALLIVSPVMAARHYNGKLNVSFAVAGETISVTPSVVTFGDSVTATVTTAHPSPWVYVHCYDGSGQAFSATLSALGDLTFPITQTPSWSGGAADCYATLLGFEDGYNTPLAETTFAVVP